MLVTKYIGTPIRFPTNAPNRPVQEQADLTISNVLMFTQPACLIRPFCLIRVLGALQFDAVLDGLQMVCRAMARLSALRSQQFTDLFPISLVPAMIVRAVASQQRLSGTAAWQSILDMFYIDLCLMLCYIGCTSL